MTSRTFPETDQERFAYDGSDKVTSLAPVAKTGNLTSTTEGAAGGTGPVWGTTHWGSPAQWGTPALNLTTTFTPDSWGNVTATTDPLTHVSNQTYDLDRRTILSIDPDPGTGVRTATNTVYDFNGRVIEVDKGTTNAAGTTFTALETTLAAFDPNGNKTQVSVLNGPSGTTPLTVTQMSYDPLNRVVCTAERENAAAFSSLPGACFQSAGSSVGPDHITRLTYDLAGQKLVETRGVGTSIQSAYATYAYSLDGNVSTILDANNNLTTNLYDGFNRLSKVEYPVTTLGANASDPTDAESYTYDANGNRLTLTKRDEATVISFSYDALNRMATKTFAAANAAADVAYGYDFAGRPTSAKFSTVSGTPGVTWSYDAAGRRISEATNGRSLSFTYDAASNPATLTWPDGLSITYGFDPANRLTSVGSTPATVTAGYDGLSRINALGRAAGASTSTIGYDNADRMTALSHVFTPTTGNQTWGFAFTPASQLATTTSSNTAWNWTAATASAVNTVADGLNRNATVAGVTQTYDRFGNLTSDGTRTFTYDTENRLLTESGPITMALSYDPMGRLAQSVINGTTTQFLYDGDALVGEYPATGNTPLRRYVHGVGTDNPLIWYEGGTMTAANANYLLADRQGSIVGTGNSSGALTVNYTYDAYGAPNTWGTVGTVPRFRYTGQAAIPEAKLYHYKARVYDPVSGRFLQTDPVGYGPDVNWYAYVGNDPVNGSDPSGMWKPLDMGGDEFGFFGVEGDNATQGDLGGDEGLSSQTQSSAKPSLAADTKPVSTQKQSSQPGSGFSNLSTDRSLKDQKADYANPKLNGIPEAERQEAVGLAAVPAAGMAVGGAIAAAPEMAGAAVRLLAKGCGCFVAGTLVDTPVGLRSIEEIRVGDLVISRESFGGGMTNKPVTALIRPHNRAIYEVKIEQPGRGASETFGVTDDHPWMSKDGRWLTTLQLHTGDQLQTEDGTPARVASVVATNRTADTFNLEVADNHTYFVGKERVWVHNDCPEGFLKYGGAVKNAVKNKQLLEQLRMNGGRNWSKVYQDGWVNGAKATWHYFQDEAGNIFGSKVKPGWSNE